MNFNLLNAKLRLLSTDKYVESNRNEPVLTIEIFARAVNRLTNVEM